MALSGGHLGCLGLRVPVGIPCTAVGGSWRRSFLARHRAGDDHRPHSLEAGALHLVLQKHVVLWREPHTGPGGKAGAERGQTPRLGTPQPPIPRVPVPSGPVDMRASDGDPKAGAHLRIFSMQLRWRKSALTTGLPGGTSGALKRKLSSDSTEWKPCGSGSASVQKLTRWHSSVSSTRSSMMGAARRESCGAGGSEGRRAGGQPHSRPAAPHLARVVQHQRVGAAQHQLRRVLVQRPLAVPHVRHVLDDHLGGGTRSRGPRPPPPAPPPRPAAAPGPRTQWSGSSPGA